MVIQGAAVINLIIAVVGVMVYIFALLIIFFGMMRDKKTATIMFCLFVGLLIYNICLLFLQLTLGFTGRVWKFGISAAGYGTFLYSSLCTYIVTNYILILVSLSKRTKKGIRPGFDEMKLPDDGMSHKGIPNVRERLRHICGGELIVASEPGNGTTVTMILPKG